MAIWKVFFNSYHSIWCDQRDKLASKDPIWVTIEARRHIDGHEGSSIFLSEKHNLTMDDHETQQAIEEDLLPHTYIHKINWWLDEHGPKRQYHNLRDFYQRGKRGYANSDIWSLHYYLGNMIADCLDALADTHKSIPMQYLDKANGDVDAGSVIWAKDLKKIALWFREANSDESCGHEQGKYPDKCIDYVYCKYRNKNTKKAFKWLGRMFYDAWS